jgi:glycosyltransferase involved in cell wall biosynthesis
MSTPKRIGIFMPCYNLDAYLDESLASLDAQTSKDFYLIIADDASTNNTAKKKLQSIQRQNCKVYFEKKNLGLIKISNKYMTELDTDYIMLLSPEDTLEPTFIEKSIQYLEKHPEKAAVCTWIQQFGDYTDIIKYSEKTCKLPYMLIENHYSGAAVIRKEKWVEAGKHDTDPNLFPNLDYDLWLCMLERQFELGVINEPLFNWRSLKSSLSHDVTVDKQLRFKKAILQKHTRLYQKHCKYVLDYYLDQVAKYQRDYTMYEDGHTWLDTEYRRLSNENSLLAGTLHDSIVLPHTKHFKRLINKLRKN